MSQCTEAHLIYTYSILALSFWLSIWRMGDRRVQVLMLTVINFQMCSEDKCECSVL